MNWFPLRRPALAGGVLALLVTLCSGARSPAADPLPDTTVWIRAGDRSTGTGFVVDVKRRWVLTARHVLADQEKAEVFFRDPDFTDQQRDDYLRNRQSLRQSGRCVDAVLVAKNDRADLALIRLDSLPPNTRAVELSASGPLAGEACHSVGHRLDAGALWARTDGLVRQSGQLREGYAWAGQKIGTGVRIHYAQLPIDTGDSGSAVLNSRGQVIGLVSALAGRSPGTAILISAEEIQRFLGEVRSQAPPVAKPAADIPPALRATVWIRPEATDGRYAGVLISTPSGEWILTSAAATGTEERVDVVFPLSKDGCLLAEQEKYDDRLGLFLSGHLRPAIVLGLDRERDLALLNVASRPETSRPLRLATMAPKPGDKISAVSHPAGVELRWLLSSGSIRGHGRVVLHPDRPEKAPTVGSLLLQLPHQGNCSGGPVLNTAGEVLTILASREGARQELAYGVSEPELNSFLAATKRWRSPESADEFLALVRKYQWLDDTLTRETIDAGLRKHPTDYQLQAERLLRLGALSDLKAGYANLPGKPVTSLEFLAQGRLLERLGDKAGAIRSHDLAIAGDAKNIRALAARASLSDTKDAERYLAMAGLIDPTYPDIRRVRAATLPRSTDDQRRAVIDELTRLLEWEPYDVAARRDRAGLWRSLREFKKAEADEVRLTELSPDSPANWLRLAEGRLLQGKEPTATPALRSALRADAGTHPWVIRLIGAHAERLVADDAKDTRRVLDWLSRSLGAINAELPPRKQADIAKIQDDASISDAQKIQSLLQLLKHW